MRARLTAKLEQARIRIHIDVGFSDDVQPTPAARELKQIAPPVLRMYPAEAVIAEKLHAVIILDIRNSRMKDFYDIWYLARTRSFEGSRKAHVLPPYELGTRDVFAGFERLGEARAINE